VHRFPWRAEVGLDRSGCWAGTYENTPDHFGILGADPQHPTWLNACGFSGHGLMQAPEIGRLTCEQITTAARRSLDVSALRLERFAGTAGRQVGLVF
jgi:sarcosine oxidase subunit beta